MYFDLRNRAVGSVVVFVAVLVVGTLASIKPEPLMAQSQVEMMRIDVGSFTFDARAAGPADGPLILMLHGFPQSSFEWRLQMPVLAEMGFRVVAPDQRGYSPGARPPGVEDYAISELVGDAVGIADALGRERFHVVGHDWGAAVTWFTALLHPDRLESIVPISVPHPFAFAQVLSDPDSEQTRMSGYMEMFRSDSAESMFLADDAAMLRGIYGGAGLEADEVQHYVDLLGTREALGAALNWYRATNFASASGESTPIRMPTTFIWSTEDVALGREGAELTKEFVEGPYRFEVLEGVSHWVPEHAPDRLNQILREHFAAFAPDSSS